MVRIAEHDLGNFVAPFGTYRRAANICDTYDLERIAEHIVARNGTFLVRIAELFVAQNWLIVAILTYRRAYRRAYIWIDFGTYRSDNCAT